jgi:Fe2+ transport system protein FeoA
MAAPDIHLLEGNCAHAAECPLSQVAAGSTVCVKSLPEGEEVSARLRELGLCEEQHIKLLSRHTHYVCEVCNAKLGLSEKLARSIRVQPLGKTRRTN